LRAFHREKPRSSLQDRCASSVIAEQKGCYTLETGLVHEAKSDKANTPARLKGLHSEQHHSRNVCVFAETTWIAVPWEMILEIVSQKAAALKTAAA
jgi:hypothetical protein